MTISELETASHLFRAQHTRTHARFSVTSATSPLMMMREGQSDGVFADVEQYFYLFGVSGGVDD